MPFDLEAATQAAAALEMVLRPIATELIDTSGPDWLSRARPRPKPLDPVMESSPLGSIQTEGE